MQIICTISIPVEISEAVVNEENLVRISANAHHEVSRLDIAMDDAGSVQLLQALDLEEEDEPARQ